MGLVIKLWRLVGQISKTFRQPKKKTDRGDVRISKCVFMKPRLQVVWDRPTLTATSLLYIDRSNIQQLQLTCVISFNDIKQWKQTFQLSKLPCSVGLLLLLPFNSFSFNFLNFNSVVTYLVQFFWGFRFTVQRLSVQSQWCKSHFLFPEIVR